MDAIEKLKAEARVKRDRAIEKARREYRDTLKSLRTVTWKLRGKRRSISLQTQPEGGDLAGLSAARAAEVVLREQGPLLLVELAALIQARGCRAGDDPKRLVENLRGSLKYHAGRFVRGEDGRWERSD